MRCNKCQKHNCTCNNYNNNSSYLIKLVADLQKRVDELESIDQSGFIRTINGKSASESSGNFNEEDPTVPSWAKSPNKPIYNIVDIPNLSTNINNKQDKISGKSLSTNDYTNEDKNLLINVSTNKVDKVSGKQLSTNDFTNSLKIKLEGLENYDDSSLINDISNLNSVVVNKVDKEINKGLVITSDINKLSDLDTQAEIDYKISQITVGEKGNVTPSTVPGDITINGVYRASEKGDYSNLSPGLEAKEGYATWFLKNNSTWTLYSEYNIVENNGNAPDYNSILTYKKGDLVSTDTNKIFKSLKPANLSTPINTSEDWVNDIQKNDNISFLDIKGGLISGIANVNPVGSDMTIGASSTNKYMTYLASFGDTFHVRTKGGISNRSWAFVSADNKVLAISTNTTSLQEETIIAPPFTNRLIINNLDSNLNVEVLKINSLSKKIVDNEKILDILNKNKGIQYWNINNTVPSQWFNNNGVIEKQDFTGNFIYTSRGIHISSISPGDAFQIFTVSSNTRRAFYFTDSSGNILSTALTFGNNITTPLWAIAPNNATNLYVNIINTDGINNTSVSKGFLIFKDNNYLSEISNKLNNYLPIINVIGKSYNNSIKYNSIYQNNGTTINDSLNRIYDANSGSIKIPCQSGDLIIVRGVGGFSGRLYCFATSNGTLFQQEPEYKAVSNADFSINPAVLKAPDNSSSCYINVRLDQPFDVIIISETLIKIILEYGGGDIEEAIELAQEALNKADEAINIAENANTTINNITYENGSGYEWFFHNATKRADYMLARQFNTAKANKMIATNLVNLKDVDVSNGGSIKFMHDATIQYHLGLSKLYCTSICNDVNNDDSSYSTNVYTALLIVDANSSGVISTSNYKKYIIGKNGDVLDGVTIKSGCGVPNSYLVGDILHILFTAEGTDNNWYEFHCEYNCMTDSVGIVRKAKLDGVDMTCLKISSYTTTPTVNGMVSINGSIAFLNGYYYACVCSVSWYKSGVILRTNNFQDWEFVSVPTFTGFESKAQFEGSMATINGDLFLALRQENWDTSDELNPVVLARLDAGGNVLENILVPSTTSRPAFFMRGTTELYLAYSTDTRFNTVIMRIDPANLKNSYPVQDIPFYGNYLTIFPRSLNLQYVCFTLGTTGVRVSSMNFGQRDSNFVMNALMDIISI